MSEVIEKPEAPAVKVVPKEAPLPAVAMELATPNWKRLDPPWWLVEATLTATRGWLDFGHGRFGDFCVLSLVGEKTYVQTAWQDDRWVIERRISDSYGNYVHYRAEPPDNPGSDMFSNIEDVIDEFKKFYDGMTHAVSDDFVWIPFIDLDWTDS